MSPERCVEDPPGVPTVCPGFRCCEGPAGEGPADNGPLLLGVKMSLVSSSPSLICCPLWFVFMSAKYVCDAGLYPAAYSCVPGAAVFESIVLVRLPPIPDLDMLVFVKTLPESKGLFINSSKGGEMGARGKGFSLLLLILLSRSLCAEYV